MKGAQWINIRSDRQKGAGYVELGRKYHMDPRTTKRYAGSPQKPEYTLSEPKPTKMDPYKQIVGEWLEEVSYSALRIKVQRFENGILTGKSALLRRFPPLAARHMESKSYVQERNRLIVGTRLPYIQDKRTVNLNACIHPFIDGNGCTGRLLVNPEQVKAGFLPKKR